MDHPEQQIQHIIRSLTQYSRDDQRTALEDYFLPDAYFVHPFCRVPSFGDYKIPFTDLTINSRQFVFYIYQWYRILSPDIQLTIDSTSFDKNKNLLYVTIRQTFTLWFVPFSLWQANVKLVTVLELQRLSTDKSHKPLLGEAPIPVNDDLRLTPQPPKLYFIKGQQDHYQVEDFLKFIAPWGASLLWMAWQLYATFICAIGVIFLRFPIAWFQKHVLRRDTKAIKTQ
ncbi:hypothetical protein K445DRAFT_153106 [Daldinia sp. EC12]|nr:hypothetical protein F4774DRAFT_34892 [Daldinia eschscholtzii]OTB19926.1 hypothetical protein K445DRAFT_153106 [Daldinia sp. EC12]